VRQTCRMKRVSGAANPAFSGVAIALLASRRFRLLAGSCILRRAVSNGWFLAQALDIIMSRLPQRRQQK
jgi:hypothetical protein